MTNDASNRLQAVFRAAVVIGCVSLLAGVAGIFYFAHQDRQARSGLPEDVSVVLLSGREDEGDLEVVVRWRTSDGGEHEETGVPGRAPDRWFFRSAPEGTPLRLTFYSRTASTRTEWFRQDAILTRGGIFEVVAPLRGQAAERAAEHGGRSR